MIKGNWQKIKKDLKKADTEAWKGNPKYYGAEPGIDPEIEPLCDALNIISGVQTTSCCCGHDKNPIRIWFIVDSIKTLSLILWAGCHRWWSWEGGDWNLKLDIGDPDKKGKTIKLCLESKNKGYESYLKAVQLSLKISAFSTALKERKI